MRRQLRLPERTLDRQQRHLLGTHQRDPGIDDGVARLLGRLLARFLARLLGHGPNLAIYALACNLTTECNRIHIDAIAWSDMRPVMEPLFIPLALAAGALLAVQAGANAQLSKAVGSPFAATTLQLSVGALLLLLLTLASGTLLALSLLPNARWWHVVGGTASAFYVISGILLFPRIGAVVSVGLFIAGQVLASTALDLFGLLGVTATGLSPGVMGGAVLVMAGAALIVLGQTSTPSEVGPAQYGWIALALLAGAVLPVQGAVNALLKHDLGGATFAVGAVSFIVADRKSVV